MFFSVKLQDMDTYVYSLNILINAQVPYRRLSKNSFLVLIHCVIFPFFSHFLKIWTYYPSELQGQGCSLLMFLLAHSGLCYQDQIILLLP